jgi:ubiquinone biosynthesis protein Coq4
MEIDKNHRGRRILIELQGHEQVSTILKDELRAIYGDQLKSLEVQSVMQYPMKENKYVTIYNLDVEGMLPVVRAKIVVDVSKGTLERFEPDML